MQRVERLRKLKYNGGGYFRDDTIPKGTTAEIVHAPEVLEDALQLATELEAAHAQNVELCKRIEELETQLLIIGDKAVVDWDDETVGQVDAVVKTQPPQTYIEFVRKLYSRGEEIDQLRQQLQEAERQRDELKKHFIVKYGLKLAFEVERDQLIKVVDALMHTTSPHASLNDHVKAREAYSLLPHVQAKKENKR